MTMTLTQDDLRQISTLVTDVIETSVNPRFDEIMVAMQAYSTVVETQLNEIRADIAELKADVAELKIEVLNLREDVAMFQQRMSAVEHELFVLSTHLKAVDRRDHEDTTATMQDVFELKKRIGALEKEQGRLKSELAALYKS